MKRVFVTGAAGFIGFHTAKALAQRGALVAGFDNFNSYYDPQLKKDRAALLLEQGISIQKGDLTDRQELEKAIVDFQPTHCVHLAAQAGVRYSIQNPTDYVTSNILGFLNLLEITKDFMPSMPIVYASSSSVYGRNEKVPFSELDRTDDQASFYGVTKKCNELMASCYHHLYQLQLTGLRFFTVYGPWGRPDMAYYAFTKAIMEGSPIEVYADGLLMRDFTYIDDIVEGILASLEKKSGCQIYNLGNHRPVEVNLFLSTLEEIIGKKAIRIAKPMQKGDVTKTYADIAHSHKDLGFTPMTDIKTGLTQFVEWYRGYTPLWPKPLLAPALAPVSAR